jgi:hypothetical protein
MLLYSLCLQNKFCIGQFHGCQKDLHALHTGTSVGVEMIWTLTLKILSLCFWVITINPCFMTFDDFWKQFGFLWSFSWRQWRTLTWFCFDWYSEGKKFVGGTVTFSRHYVTVMHARTLMQINLQNYCYFTQWMSSALTAAVPPCNQSRNFRITSHKWINGFF